MKALQIDFQRKRMPMLYLVGCLAFAVGLMLAGWETWRFAENLRTLQELTAENTRLQTLIDATRGPEPVAAPPSAARAERATRAIDRLNAPWVALFEAVESAVSEDVTLLGLDPDLQLNEVRLRAEARTVDAMLQFLRRVDATGVLTTPYLDSYQLYLQDPQHPARFTVVAHWKRPAAKESQAADMSGSVADPGLPSKPAKSGSSQ